MYATWTEPTTGSMHMLDICIASINICKAVRDCEKVRYGVRNDHGALKLKLHVGKIAFKSKVSKRRQY